MRAFARVLDLRNDPQVIEAYKDHHRHTWPEVVGGLRSIGIGKMKIFLRANHLFMYFEAPDGFVPERDFLKFASTPRARAWEDLMRTFQQPVPEARRGEWWAELEEVFDLDWF